MSALTSFLLALPSGLPTEHEGTRFMTICALLIAAQQHGLTPLLPTDVARARLQDGYCGDYLKRVQPGEQEVLSLASAVQDHPDACYLVFEGTLVITVSPDERLVFRAVRQHAALERAYGDVRYGTILGRRHRLSAEHRLTFEQVQL